MDLKEFLASLRVDLSKAVTDVVEKAAPAKPAGGDTAPPADAVKQAEDLRKAVDTVLAALDLSKTGDDASPLAKAIAELRKNDEDYRTVLEKMLERMEKIEGLFAVKKSIDGQDGDSTVTKKVGFDSVVRSAVRGGTVRMR